MPAVTSQKQIAANRRNAARSTGPRTEEGKAESRMNSLRHGLLAERVMVVEDGDLQDFIELQEHLLEELEPLGRLEEGLVDRIASLLWRLDRAAHIERGLLMVGRGPDELPPAARLALAVRRDSLDAQALERVGRYEGRLERSLFRCLHELERLQARRAGEDVPVPAVVDIDLRVAAS